MSALRLQWRCPCSSYARQKKDKKAQPGLNESQTRLRLWYSSARWSMGDIKV